MGLPKTLTIVVPVYNEATILERNIRRLHAFCTKKLHAYQWTLIIADNGSNDGSNDIGKSLEKLPSVTYLSLKKTGKGAAVMTAWRQTNMDIGLFLDADLAANLDIIPRLITALKLGADIAVGSRAHPESQVHRTTLRRIISHINNRTRRALFHTTTYDTACGVKGVTKKVITQLIPSVQNQQWFFDTELLILAERNGYTITELPVVWRDRAHQEGGSKIKLLTASIEYLKEMIRLKYRLLSKDT